MARLKVTDELLTAALAGFQSELDQIQVKMGEIRRMLGDGARPTATSSPTKTPRRKFSAASRRKMRIAQKLRWKKIKQAAEPSEAATPKPKKRRMSAAGKAAIVAALKKRWAAVKAAKPAQKSPVVKKAGRKKIVMKKAVVRKPKGPAKTPEQVPPVAAGK